MGVTAAQFNFPHTVDVYIVTRGFEEPTIEATPTYPGIKAVVFNRAPDDVLIYLDLVTPALNRNGTYQITHLGDAYDSKEILPQTGFQSTYDFYIIKAVHHGISAPG